MRRTHKVVALSRAQKSVDAAEVGFKWIEQRKRFRRTQPIEIPSKTEGVLAQSLSDTVN